jgi:phosphoribosyl-ATP pyrophosphohydrolase/phosphoribosyl-AMP cyclohydrolase
VQKLWSSLPQWLPLPAGTRVPTIIQDEASGRVLMLVEMNQEALALIAATGRVHYYHPHKRKVVAKGEASGHFQEVLEVRLSCRGDQLVLKVRAAGGACELGYASCFFRRLTPEGWEIADPKTFDPEEVYPEIAFSH